MQSWEGSTDSRHGGGGRRHMARTQTKTGAMKWYAWGLVSRPYIQQRKVREEEKETKKDRVWCVYKEKREQGTRKRKKNNNTPLQQGRTKGQKGCWGKKGGKRCITTPAGRVLRSDQNPSSSQNHCSVKPDHPHPHPAPCPSSGPCPCPCPRYSCGSENQGFPFSLSPSMDDG